MDANKVSPYEFYQYWRNIEDESVEKVLSLLTFLDMEEVKRLASLKDEKTNEAKKIAAYEITKLILFWDINVLAWLLDGAISVFIKASIIEIFVLSNFIEGIFSIEPWPLNNAFDASSAFLASSSPCINLVISKQLFF